MVFFRVLDPGVFTTMQDEGRPGHAHLGVPRSGALDQESYRLANRLVGNRSGATALETTMRGPRLLWDAQQFEDVSEPVWVAVTGAPVPVRINGRPAAFAAAVRLLPGEVLEIGTAVAGLRSYVAVSGGFVNKSPLRSGSTDVLSGLGPPALAVGHELPVGPAAPIPSIEFVVPTGVFHQPVLDLIPGPRADWFTPEALMLLARTAWQVSPTSNRVGLRLEGPALERVRFGELPSEGMMTGSVQVPGNGRPVLFLNDHPVTGGYPVIGVVTRASLDRAAQAAPGTTLRFRLRTALR
ncbi:5-oxoprolinase subunit C family protein [Kineosporia babensis]|uniref:Biotin-dependent carboxyltransferase family protein n=1 Tax=Kineosporia babensis TaxID=499548 RepID=A0A9X1N9J8_9ACTN|nr:biotin-dependent carboxyltransferase family protein [Kineosporia babensis]MCD5309779.1 biotin-dependent carboxyltransferase family protein [Kineosporia babensis]